MPGKSEVQSNYAVVRRTARNRSVKTALKTRISKAEKLINKNEVESAQKAAAAALKALDKAAEKGVIHPNAAARRKSRLARKLGKLSAALPASAAEPKKPEG